MSGPGENIQQLWYTWAKFGYGVKDDYGIRAASEELTEYRSDRVKALDNFAYYELPPGTDYHDNDLEQKAPYALSLVHLPGSGDKKGERVLIHKVYAGKDGTGRPG